MSGNCEIGLIGLAVMGQNLALNIASKGYSIAVFNRSPEKVAATVDLAAKEGNLPLKGYTDMKQFVQAIAKPRKIIILVKAGAPVDEVLENLKGLLENGDCVIDGGNEWYENTERRAEEFERAGLKYMGMGISGGEDGARHGPALMPGGAREAYENVAPILKRIAAKAESDGEPCVSYIGKGGAGNYVKMVHNGIEYGDMQLIAEVYYILRHVGGMTNDELAKVFASYSQTRELGSFLIDITSDILAQKDDQVKDQYLVDVIDDRTGSKGTGLWTCREAALRGAPCPTIQAALDSRYMSQFKTDREAAAEKYRDGAAKAAASTLSKAELVQLCLSALYCSKVCSYAQGMGLLRVTSDQMGWGLDLAAIARGWRGGCIIRAHLLEDISGAFEREKSLSNLLLEKSFEEQLLKHAAAWRKLVALAVQHAVPAPALAASLVYFDSLSCARLPLNLVQAQRDYFGAHTYFRTDREGVFHTQWARGKPLN